MHYRNGREAKNGDKVVQLGFSDAKPTAIGILHSAVAGSDHCNGSIAPIQNTKEGACLCDCLHLEDVEQLIKAAGFDKRPEGK
jgi:hypothetical protein